jgi:hypothetical protein
MNFKPKQGGKQPPADSTAPAPAKNAPKPTDTPTDTTEE